MRLRSGWGLGLGVMLLTVQAAGAQDDAEIAIRDWIEGIRTDSALMVHYDGLSHDAATDSVVLSGLELRAPQYDIEATIESLAVTGYAPGPDGAFTASEIRIDAATLKIGYADIAVEGLWISEIAVPAFGPLRWDPAKPFTSLMGFYAAAAGVDYASAGADTIRMVQVVEGFTSRMSYDNLRMGPAVDGVIASTTAGPVTMESPSPEGLVSFQVGRVEARDGDIGALIHVLDPSAYRDGVGDMVWRNALAYAAYSDITMEAPGATVTVDRYDMEDFRVRQPRRNYLSLLDTLATNPEMPQSELDELVLPLTIGLLSSYGFGQIGIEGLEVRSVGVGLAMGSFRVSDVSIEGIGEIAVDGLAAAAQDQGSVRLGRFALGGIAFPTVETIEAAIALAERGGEPDPASFIPTLGFVEIANLSVEAVGMSNISLGQFRTDYEDYVGYLPTAARGFITNLVLPAEAIPDPDTRAMLTRLGHDEIDLSVRSAYAWDEDTETISIEDLDVAVKDMGSVSAELLLRGLSRDAIKDPEKLQAALNNLSLVDGTVAFTDDSIVGKGLDILAERMKAPPETFRQQFADAMPFLLSMAAVNQPQIMDLVRKSGLFAELTPAMKSFIASPGSSLIVSLAPPTPLPLHEIAEIVETSPEALFPRLGLSITSSPPESGARSGTAPQTEGGAPAEVEEGGAPATAQ